MSAQRVRPHGACDPPDDGPARQRAHGRRRPASRTCAAVQGTHRRPAPGVRRAGIDRLQVTVLQNSGIGSKDAALLLAVINRNANQVKVTRKNKFFFLHGFHDYYVIHKKNPSKFLLRTNGHLSTRNCHGLGARIAPEREHTGSPGAIPRHATAAEPELSCQHHTAWQVGSYYY